MGILLLLALIVTSTLIGTHHALPAAQAVPGKTYDARCQMSDVGTHHALLAMGRWARK